ncbi:DUF2179 domain-containing protein [bacterium]|nr:DUF2179 domain-containing protein [bacterium]
MENFLQTELFRFVVMPLLIIIARIIDVSLGTLRVIFVSKGLKKLAPILGFFEVLIWLIAIGQIMQNLDSVVSYIAYALGFALGTYIGISIENKLAIGKVLLRVITRSSATELVEELRKKNFGITALDAEGLSGQVTLFFTVVSRQRLMEALDTIRKFNPRAFYTIEDVRFVSDGEGVPEVAYKRSIFHHLGFGRKGK